MALHAHCHDGAADPRPVNNRGRAGSPPRLVKKQIWEEITMTKPEILMMGPYPAWDLDDLESNYTVHRLWEAADRAAFLGKQGGNIRAIATRGEIGASAELMKALPRLEIVSCYGVGTDANDLSHAKANGIRVTNT